MSFVNGKSNWTIRDLHEKIEKREKTKVDVYDKLFKRIEFKIGCALANDSFCCFYQIPEFECGLPGFNMTKCVRYLMDKIKEKQLNVKYKHKYILFVWWSKPKKSKFLCDDIDRESYQYIDDAPRRNYTQYQPQQVQRQQAQIQSQSQPQRQQNYKQITNRPSISRSKYNTAVVNTYEDEDRYEDSYNGNSKDIDTEDFNISYRTRNTKKPKETQQRERDSIMMNYIPRKKISMRSKY
jgi:hypothetical protein